MTKLKQIKTYSVSRTSLPPLRRTSKKGGLEQNPSVLRTAPLDEREHLKRNLDGKIERMLEILRKRNWTIGIMESCTGGAIANAITNIPGASDVFDESKVTYSVESKIRAGVRKEIIEEFGVYSAETAGEMAGVSRGEVGVGITGNLPGEVFVAVRVGNRVESRKVKVESENNNNIKARKEMKVKVVEKVMEMISDNL